MTRQWFYTHTHTHTHTLEGNTTMNTNTNTNTNTNIDNVIFDPAIHAVDADGNPVMKLDGTFKLKPGRKVGTSTGAGTGTRGGFDVEAVTGAYLARAMTAGDLNAITVFTGLTKGQRVQFLRTTPEYAALVTDKLITDAADAINSILDAAGEENYAAIMDRVRFGQ